MYLEWPLQPRPTIDTVSSHLGNCRTPRSASCILWWMDRRFMFVPQDQWSPRRKSTLHRCHFWISVGEQMQNLSPGTSTDFNKSLDYWSIRSLWHRHHVPPEEFFNVVLSSQSGGKLTLPFCYTCVEQQQAELMLDRRWTCTHTHQERLIRSTWCTLEISRAV